MKIQCECGREYNLSAGEVPKQESLTQSPEPTIEVIDITVDQNKSIDDLVKAGNYDWQNDDVNVKNFPVDLVPEGKELVRVRFNRILPNRDAVIAARAELKLEPVTSIRYLLTIGADKPDMQKEAPISDIDSVWSRPGGYVNFPNLWSSDPGRELGLLWYGDVFFAHEWILALRQQS